MMRTYTKGLIPFNMEQIDKYYINDIDRNGPGVEGFLTDTQVRDILVAYRAHNDLAVRDQLIRTYGRYVVSIAKNYQNQGLPLCDLISEGVLGLISAIENFDITNETQFMTYANVVISRQMREALDQFNLPVRVPKNIRNQHRRVKSGIENLNLLGAQENEIRDQFINNEVDLEYYYNPTMYSKLHAGNYSNEDDLIGEDMFFVEKSAPDDKLNRLDLKRDVARVFRKRLTKNEAKVLRLYFGIDQPYQMVSIVDLGKKLGMSGERARQLKESGLKKLRAPECKEILQKYL